MPKRIPRRAHPDALPVTPPEPPRRVPFALAIVRDGLVSAAPVSRLHQRRQTRVR
ncbi:MAG TPA: hypothetical protein VGS01_11125 [Candidatus Limnocylindria bacterium]|nr:hypothetical protein [Candidatus Limnocylindria bacterium]